MRIFAGIIVALGLAAAGAGSACAQQAGGSFGVGVRICGAETAGCKTAPEKIKKKRFTVARSGFVPRAAFATPRYTCGAAAISVEQAGYTAISRVDCTGRTFAYIARKNGKRFRVEVEAGSGTIKSVRALARPQKSLA